MYVAKFVYAYYSVTLMAKKQEKKKGNACQTVWNIFWNMVTGASSNLSIQCQS